MRWLVVVAIAACTPSAHLGSCDDSLAGVWTSGSGDRWMVLDNGAALEAYPMFDDAIGSRGDVTIAPRVIDLQRRGGQLVGEIQRRTMWRGEACEAHATMQIRTCHDDVLEIDLGELAAPLGFAPCRWPPVAPPHVDGTALPFGSAAARGQAPAVDGTALPFGSAAARGQAPAVDGTALPFGSAAARGQAPAVDGTALPFGSAAARGQAPAVERWHRD